MPMERDIQAVRLFGHSGWVGSLDFRNAPALEASQTHADDAFSPAVSVRNMRRKRCFCGALIADEARKPMGPNKAMELMRMLVTDHAFACSAPSIRIAHL